MDIDGSYRTFLDGVIGAQIRAICGVNCSRHSCAPANPDHSLHEEPASLKTLVVALVAASVLFAVAAVTWYRICLLYTSPSPRDS